MHRQHYRFAGYSRLEIAFMLVLGIFIGLLAVTKYLELSTAAKEAMEPGLIEGVRSGIAAYAEEAKSRGNSKLFPSTLDDAASGAATPRDPFFGRVLEKGVAVEGWSKLRETITSRRAETPSFTIPNRENFSIRRTPDRRCR